MAETKIGRLLIVEDEPLEQIALCGNVKRIYQDAFEILTAEDGIDAKKVCEEKNPDIVLVDINIPGISGLELIQFLMEHHFRGKILIITAYDTSDYIRQALSLGVIDYLLKPVSAKELREAMDKCIQMLKKDREQKEREISSSIVSSYAEQYLISDIVKGRYPVQTLEEAYHWGKNGRLNVWVAGILNADVQEALEEKESVLSKYFWIVSGKIEEVTILFLNPRVSKEEAELSVILQAQVETAYRKRKMKTMILSSPQATYDQIGETANEILKKIRKANEGVWIEQRAWEKEIDKLRGKKLCRKWEQRLRERNAENFVRMFRRKVQETNQYWGCVSLFLTACSAFDWEADLLELLELFQEEKPYGRLEKWLEKYDKERDSVQCTEEKNKILFAIAWMREHFSEDISRFTVAAKIGLNETYFSHLFKQETGDSFVHVLTEIRMEHAKKMLDLGIADMDEIARACGYYNKKYFFEVFKRFTGYSITDYQREKKK